MKNNCNNKKNSKMLLEFYKQKNITEKDFNNSI